MRDKKEMEKLNMEKPPISKVSLFPSSRFLVTFMAFGGCFMTYVLRLNLGFALVCMIKPIKANLSLSLESDEQECINNLSIPEAQGNNLNSTQQGEFEWGKNLQGLLLSAFFYGYIITQIPAGWLCKTIGPKRVLLTGIGFLSALTLLVPAATTFSPYVVVAIRILQGIFAAVSFPAIHTLVSQWAPPNELGTLMTIAYSGIYVGTLVTYPISGLLCQYGFSGGWPSIFYVTGVLGFVFTIVGFFTIYDSSGTHPRISDKEKIYLEENIKESSKKLPTPWKDILTSAPVWAIVVAHVCCNFGFYTLLINLPLYMKEIMKFDVKQNGFLSSLPYIISLFMSLAIGKLTDFIRRKDMISLTKMRKLFTTVGMIIPGLCLFAITYLTCKERYIAVGVLTLCQAMATWAFAGGFFYNHVDIAPQYAGILMGIGNMFATIPGIVSPQLVGYLTPNGKKEEWYLIFYIATAAYFTGTIFYLVFGSSERQKWSLETESESEENGNMKMEKVN